MSDLVSVITAVYNSERFLADCIESVQNQSYTNWEHILVNDCSSDNSVDVIKSYASLDKRIILRHLGINSGAGVARNLAIKLASGKYIAFLDSDDFWHPEKLSKQVFFMQKNHFHFTFTSYQKVNESGDLHGKSILAPKSVNFKNALPSNPIGCLTAIYDCSFFGKKYMPEIRKRQDFALWLELLSIEMGYGLDEPLAYYRLRRNSISSNKLTLIKYQWELYRKILKLSVLQSLYYLCLGILLKLNK